MAPKLPSIPQKQVQWQFDYLNGMTAREWVEHAKEMNRRYVEKEEEVQVQKACGSDAGGIQDDV